MILGDILLIIEGLVIAITLNPISIAMSDVNLFLKVLYFLFCIFGIIMLVTGVRGLRHDIHNYVAQKNKANQVK